MGLAPLALGTNDGIAYRASHDLSPPLLPGRRRLALQQP
jgi:hypothetical protein